MKTCKKLLAITIALVLLVSTLVSGLVVSAADATTTLAIGTTTIKEGTTTADVEFVLTFAEATKAPHSLCTITAAEGLTLSELKIDAVDYVSIGDTPVEDDELIDADAEVTINNDGKNIAAGKVLFESAVDSKAPTVNSITFTATFAVAADAAVGDYAVNAEIDATNWGEDDIAVTVTAGAVVVEAAVVEPECDHANTEFYYDDTHEIVAAQGELQGTNSVETAKGKIYFKCTDCEEIIEEDVNYYYYYTTGTQNASLKSEILFNFKAQPKHLNMQGTFQDAYFVLDMEKETGLVRQVTNYADATYEDGTKPYYTVSMGIAAKEMTTAMISTVFVKYNDQWWSGYQFNKKFVDFVNERFVAKDGTDLEKTMFADMLTFGAAAQTHFGFNTADLATDYLGEYSSYVTTTEPTIEDTSVNGLLNATQYDHVGYNSYGLNLGSIIKINLNFRTDFYKGEEPLGELSAVCTYTDNDGNPQSKVYTSADYEPVPNKANRYQFSYDGIAAKDMRKKVTFTINNESGPIGYDLKASIEDVTRMLIDSTSSETLKVTLAAMIKYGDSANAYFAS